MHLNLHFLFKLSCLENYCAEPCFFQSFLKKYLETRGKKLVLIFLWPFKICLCLVFPHIESYILNQTAVQIYVGISEDELLCCGCSTCIRVSKFRIKKWKKCAVCRCGLCTHTVKCFYLVNNNW